MANTKITLTRADLIEAVGDWIEKELGVGLEGGSIKFELQYSEDAAKEQGLTIPFTVATFQEAH